MTQPNRLLKHISINETAHVPAFTLKKKNPSLKQTDSLKSVARVFPV